MPKYLWRPYTRAIKSLGQYEEAEARLNQLTGLNMDKLIELFAAGYTLKAPESNYFTTDENGQMRIERMII